MEILSWLVPSVLILVVAVAPVLNQAGIRKVVDQKLYSQDGLPLYITRPEFEKRHEELRQTLCRKMDEVKDSIGENRGLVKEMFSGMIRDVRADLKDFDRKRDDARQENVEIRERIVRIETDHSRNH